MTQRTQPEAFGQLGQASNIAEPKPKAAKINLPRNGKSVFAWVKLLENTFGEKLMPLMVDKAKDLGFSRPLASGMRPETRTIALFAAGHCMKSSKYNGQFDHLGNEIAADSSGSTHRSAKDSRRQRCRPPQGVGQQDEGSDSQADRGPGQ